MMTPWQVQDDPLSRRLAALREWAAMSTELCCNWPELRSISVWYLSCPCLSHGLAYIDTITVNYGKPSTTKKIRNQITILWYLCNQKASWGCLIPHFNIHSDRSRWHPVSVPLLRMILLSSSFLGNFFSRTGFIRRAGWGCWLSLWIKICSW